MIASRLLVMIRLSPLVLSHTSALRLPLEEMRRSHVEASVAEKETTASPHPDFPLKAIRKWAMLTYMGTDFWREGMRDIVPAAFERRSRTGQGRPQPSLHSVAAWCVTV